MGEGIIYQKLRFLIMINHWEFWVYEELEVKKE